MLSIRLVGDGVHDTESRFSMIVSNREFQLKRKELDSHVAGLPGIADRRNRESGMSDSGTAVY